MKLSRRNISVNYRAIPDIRYESEGETTLTSYAGLVVFKKLFQSLSLVGRLKPCFEHIVDKGSAFEIWRVSLILIVHFLIGFKRLRDIDYYSDDPSLPKRNRTSVWTTCR